MENTTTNNVTLAQCIASVESGGNIYAMRFEPVTLQAMREGRMETANIQPYQRGYMDTTTQQAILATSWGLYQIMGYNLYALGYRKSVLDFIVDASEQLTMLEAFFSKNLPDVSPHGLMSALTFGELEAIGQVYNGSGAPYARALVAAYQKLKTS